MITPDFEVAVGGYAEGDETSSAAAGDLAAGEVIDPFTGGVFVPGGVVIGVEDWGGLRESVRSLRGLFLCVGCSGVFLPVCLGAPVL